MWFVGLYSVGLIAYMDGSHREEKDGIIEEVVHDPLAAKSLIHTYRFMIPGAGGSCATPHGPVQSMYHRLYLG